MKKTLIFAAIAALFVCSCGVQNKQPNSSSLGREIAKSPAQIKAEDLNATTLRAWASYNALPSMGPASLAATAARGELAKSIAALVKSATTLYAEQYGQESLSAGEFQKKLSANTKANKKLDEVAEELVKYAPVIETNEYGQKDGSITAYACVELHPERILEAVRKNDSYIEAVNKDQQSYIDFKSENYSKSMDQAFEQLKKAKGNE